ncbi:MAG: LemA family protein [Pseudomonadota bacterium]
MEKRVGTIIRKLHAQSPRGLEDVDDLNVEELERHLDRKGIEKFMWRLGYVLRKSWVYIPSVILIIISVYYYNQLFKLQEATNRDASSVTAYRQMRQDYMTNLNKLVTAYMQHEKDVYKNVSELRSIMTGLPPEIAKQLMDKNNTKDLKSGEFLSKIFGIAEQYPDLKFSTEFHYLVTAIHDVEKDIAAARVRYNGTVSMYLTAIDTIPGNFFALIFRYKPLPYFEFDKAGVEGNLFKIDLK